MNDIMHVNNTGNQNIHIVYASDDQFAEILGVSLTSLYESNQDMPEINVYILDNMISEDNKKKLDSISAIYHRSSINWIRSKDISEELDMEVLMDRGSMSQYARLFVSSLLPEDLNRVLYLDCDIIVEQSLYELWNLDMHGKTVAALMDSFSKWYRRNIDLEPDDIMFNSGVMLIDLKRWKERDIEKKLLIFIKSKHGRIQQGDQGALNAILSHDVYCIEPKFNSVTIFYDFSYQEMLQYRKPPFFYTEAQVKDAIENPVNIHFTTSFLSRRPWVEGCQHRYVDEWIRFKKLSPWKDSPLWQYRDPPGIKGVYIAATHVMPRLFMIKFSGFLQAYVRPIFNKTGLMNRI